jgi:hypothetical protein
MIKELEAARSAKAIKDRLWIEYQALIPTANSPKMDGMPKGSGGGDMNAAIVDLRNEARMRYEAAEENWRTAERVARAQMEKLTPWLYSLCLFHYLNAMTKEQTCEVMHISESTFKRYKLDLRKYDPCVNLA